jgi:hypothetical protein
MPFDPSSDDVWRPYRGPLWNGPVSGQPYPVDWTDPFINLRASAPGPVANAPAPFSAAQLGAMAWHPPTFLNSLGQFPLPAPTPPSVPSIDPSAAPTLNGNAGDLFSRDPSIPAGGLFPYRRGLDPNPSSPIESGLFTAVPRAPFTLGLPVSNWPLPTLAQSQSPFAAGGTDLSSAPQFASPAVRRSIDSPRGLFSRDPSIQVGGLFGWDPDPTSPFAGGPFGADGHAASAPFPGAPRAPSTLGLPAPPSLTPLGPPLDSSSRPPASPSDASVAPASRTRSILFNHSPAPWIPSAGNSGAANVDQTAQSLGVSGLPLSKSGQPFLPPRPQLSTAYEQALYAARLLSPNLVDYFNKPLPPPPPFPSAPGKIPSLDNPYAVPAALEGATWLLAGLDAGIIGPLDAAGGALERSAAETALRATRAATDAPALTRAAEQILTGPYGKLSGTLPPGFQAHHLNQNAVYGTYIPRTEGFSMGMKGNVLMEPGTPHYIYHRSMEQFWDQYRRGGSLESKTPTNAEYGEASRRALIASGLSPEQASDLEAQAAAQRAAKGLSEGDRVPNIPVAIWQAGRN